MSFGQSDQIKPRHSRRFEATSTERSYFGNFDGTVKTALHDLLAELTQETGLRSLRVDGGIDARRRSKPQPLLPPFPPRTANENINRCQCGVHGAKTLSIQTEKAVAESSVATLRGLGKISGGEMGQRPLRKHQTAKRRSSRVSTAVFPNPTEEKRFPAPALQRRDGRSRTGGSTGYRNAS